MALIDNEILDISLEPVRKKRFRIDGDNDRILELNTSDVNIITRLNELYPKLEDLAQEAVKKLDIDENGDGITIIAEMSEALTEIDNEMRNLVDDLFDANVSEVCCPHGSMYDPFNGQFRFEHIIGTLADLYTNNFNKEVEKINKRVQKHTDKYTKKK